MSGKSTFEVELESILRQPMTAAQRSVLDARVVALLEGRVRRPRRFGVRLTRSAALAIGLVAVLASMFGVWAGMRSTEAPYGAHGANAYLAEIEAAKMVTPLPPDASWPSWLGQGADPNGSYGVYAGQGEVEMTSACLWFEYWLDQTDSGTRASRAGALARVLQMREWRSFSDPLINGSLDDFATLFEAVQQSDTAPIVQFVTANCAP